MMQWWTWAQRQQQEADKAREEAEKVYEAAQTKFDTARRLLSGSQWMTRGTTIPTRYGPCTVVSYRSRDHTLVLEPRWAFGPKVARLYMPIESVVAAEEARQDIERHKMVAEDQLAHDVRYVDQAVSAKEWPQIVEEDKAMRILMRWYRSEAEEKGAVAGAKAQAAVRAQEEILQDRLQAEFLHRAELAVEETRDKMYRAWKVTD